MMRQRVLWLIAMLVPLTLWPGDAAVADKTPQGAQTIPQTTLALPPGALSVRVPFRNIRGHLIVRVHLNDRDVDFAFDSGAGTTILNEGVFKEMGLDVPQNNPATMTIGDAVLHSVPITSTSFIERHPEADTSVVGLIGWDLLKNAVVRIDYAGGTLEIIDPATFYAPQTAVSVPAKAGGRVPIVAATIGNVTGDDFVLDTGAWPVAIFHQFVSAHPALFNGDTEFKGECVRTSPICGTIINKPYQVSQVEVGTAGAVPNWVVLVVPESSCFNQPLDGLIGYDYLRFFVVTIDMPHSRVYFELQSKYSRAEDPRKTG